MTKQSNRTKLDEVGVCLTLINQDIKDAEGKGYYPQRYIDDQKGLRDGYAAEQSKLQALESKKILEKRKAKAKKATEPKFGNQE